VPRERGPENAGAATTLPVTRPKPMRYAGPSHQPVIVIRSPSARYVRALPPGSDSGGPSEVPFPYQTPACIVCGGFDRLVPLAMHAEVRQLTPEERARFIAG